MTLMYRKLAMLEKNLDSRIEEAKLNGYSCDYVDSEFKRRLTNLMDQVRLI